MCEKERERVREREREREKGRVMFSFQHNINVGCLRSSGNKARSLKGSLSDKKCFKKVFLQRLSPPGKCFYFISAEAGLGSNFVLMRSRHATDSPLLLNLDNRAIKFITVSVLSSLSCLIK